MTHCGTLVTVTATLAFAATAMAQDATTASARLVDGEGADIGTAELVETGNGVLITLEVSGLPADQWVAFHVHEDGACDPATGHESAGGHFNPGSSEHGFLAKGGFHAGDMPNQRVGSDGVLRAQVLNSEVALGEGDNGILQRALMIHADADDYKSQPSGDAGARLACGVIE